MDRPTRRPIRWAATALGGTMFAAFAAAALGPIASAAPPPKAKAKVDARAIYVKNCQMCHGAKGEGIPNVGASLATAGKHSNAELTAVIMKGKPPKMPGFQATITAVQAAALVKYIKTLAPKKKG